MSGEVVPPTCAPDVGQDHAVGWVGMGAIGLPMAARVAAAGWRVFGYDPLPGQQDKARHANVDVVHSPAEAADRAEGLVVCVVRTLAQVEAALLGDGGVVRREAPPLAIVMSSVGAVGLAELAGRVRRAGGRVLDAPILGNPHSAEAGTLTVVVSGATEDVTAARPLLEHLSRSVVVLGEEVGTAQTVKMVSQLRQIVGMLATIEGVELAVRRGAAEREVLAVLAATEPSWATDNWDYARDLWERRDRSSSLGIFAKDLAAAVSDARASGLALRLTGAAHDLIEARLGADVERGPDRSTA